MDLAFAFLLLGALWALVIGAAWLMLAQLGPIRREHPDAWKGPVSLIVGAGFLAALTLALNFWHRTATAPTVSEPASATITIDSDPPGAHTYIDGSYVGVTPIAVDIDADAEHTYIIASDPREYRPFAGLITPETFGNIAVWLDRRERGEQAGLKGAAVVSELSIQGDTLKGVLEHFGDETHAFALVTFAHFGEGGSHLGDSRALLSNVRRDESRSFELANPHQGTTTVEVLDISLLNP